MLHAMLITEKTIDEIEEINNGVRPADECLETKTYFVYSCDPENDIVPEILDLKVFFKTYAFNNVWSTDTSVRTM